MARFWRWVMYRLRLRPVFWAVKIRRVGDTGTVMVLVVSRKGTPREDIYAATAEAWRSACRQLGGRRRIEVTDSGENTGLAALADFEAFPGRAG